jgi:ferredoxin
LFTACEACIEACVNEAITMRPMLEPNMSTITLPTTEIRPVPVQEKAVVPEAVVPNRGVVPLAGAALAFLGREAAPRLVDVLFTLLERKLTQSTMTTDTPVSTSTRIQTVGGRGVRRQTRSRCGRDSIRNHKGRR